MTNARCLTEGVDLPAIDCICFTDPKRSKVDIVQAAGRSLRLSKGKKFGYILIPIMVPKNQSIQEASKGTAFEEIVTTVGALSAQDSRIREYLKLIEKGKIPRSGNPLDGITKLNSLTKINPKVFEKAIKLKIWDKIAQFNFMPYEEAEKFVRSLKLKTYRPGYYNFVKSKDRPKDLPVDPPRAYKNSGWIDAGTFIGTFRKAWDKIEMATLDEVREYFKKNKIKTVTQWWKHCEEGKNPVNIPRNLQRKYKNHGWKGYGDVCGTGNIANMHVVYRPFKKARKFVQGLKFKNSKEWYEYAKSEKFPNDLPAAPGSTPQYKKVWIDMQDWLGNKTKFSGEPMKFNEAKKLMKKLKIKTYPQFKKWIKSGKKPYKFPYNPDRSYKKVWKGFPDFFGRK